MQYGHTSMLSSSALVLAIFFLNSPIRAGALPRLLPVLHGDVIASRRIRKRRQPHGTHVHGAEPHLVAHVAADLVVHTPHPVVDFQLRGEERRAPVHVVQQPHAEVEDVRGMHAERSVPIPGFGGPDVRGKGEKIIDASEEKAGGEGLSCDSRCGAIAPSQ